MEHEVKYSVLSSDRELTTDKARILNYLSQGIKVILFGTRKDMSFPKSDFLKYADIRLLQFYAVGEDCPSVTIYDGYMNSDEFNVITALSNDAGGFNLEQYVIEHHAADNNMIVEAGAGTGKTTVMIDRILFLLHTVPDLMPQDIGMITFTNDATQHMKHKIQQELMKRFKATGHPRYTLLLENCANLRIQTIDSFSSNFISEFGSSIGYGSKVSIRGYKYEKKKLLLEVLNDLFSDPNKSVEKNLGLNLRDLEKLILDFWEKLEQIGLSDNDIALIDWGMPENQDSEILHRTVSSVFGELCTRYNKLKAQNDAIEVNDIVRTLDAILSSGVVPTLKSHPLKYLFVDEFQDSDNSQIRTIAWMQKNQNLNLFVVGDVKQSIYRFRGAVDTAFEKLKGYLDNYTVFQLNRNYRTSGDILLQLDPVFRNWEQRNLLDYGNTLAPQRHHAGIFRVQPVLKQEWFIRPRTIQLIRECLDDCIAVAERNGTKNDKTQRVTVLTRTNRQLQKISEWCSEAGIPCYIRQEGTFFTSRAVLDFFALIKAYTFPSAPSCLTDCILSPYFCKAIDLESLKAYTPGSREQIAFLHEIMEELQWSEFLKKFRIKPIISVLDEIIETAKPAYNFAKIRKAELEQDGTWSEVERETQLRMEVKQYMANLDKLMTLLRSSFSGQMTDLYSIYSYLKLNIATNKTEDEVDISDQAGINYIHGLTVHRAKGLEFDTVIIPFTERMYRKDVDTEIIFDETIRPVRVGWCKAEWDDKYRNHVISQKCNNYYSECVNREYSDMDREEARLLYVALTRSIRRLECFVTDPGIHNWAGLLE